MLPVQTTVELSTSCGQITILSGVLHYLVGELFLWALYPMSVFIAASTCTLAPVIATLAPTLGLSPPIYYVGLIDLSCNGSLIDDYIIHQSYWTMM